ncbi:acyltransferase family protein [Geodermatophilus marinus]|uniref:acyltransferase family protein n=1 Tax=Geodermatophilus sp. LHW52908 TaxID=2303986 RepID=UPI000E3EAEFF|nr:acyltransferase [Geodermatophilus sp. LHW52908]RFU23439.1 acyltransferase [Geodermatophilus sp. LHW52908]
MRALDGLRLVVALMVALYHYLGRESASDFWGVDVHRVFPNADFLAHYGWLGVQIFFVISGFVICMSSWGKSVGQFATSRVVRLYPVYWAAICLTFLVVTFVPTVIEAPTLGAVLANMTMFQEGLGARHVDGVYWTLWVELRFYLLFALVVWTGLSYRKVALFCAAWTIAIPLSDRIGNGLVSYLVQPKYACFFLLGIGFYLLHRFGNQFVTWLLVGANGAFTLFRLETFMPHQEDVTGRDVHYWGVLVMVGLMALFFLALVRGRLDWMSWRWLTVAGALSYPFYLIHQNVGYTMIGVLAGRHGVSAYVVLPATVLAMLLLSWLLHRLVERPVSAFLQRQLRRPGLLDPQPVSR